MTSPAPRILVVDDAEMTLEIIQRNLTAVGYRVHTASSVAAGIDLLEQTPVDLVITDMKMPGASGLDLIRHVRENLRDTEVMMITGYATVNGAVEAVKSGAEEYLAKPFTGEELHAAVTRALDKLQLRRAARQRTEDADAGTHGLIGASRPMKRLYRSIVRAADSTATALITGESGTGKELVARAIHYGGPRSSAPFVPVNCGAIPEHLLESELFGYVKGAFTGAITTRAGFFQTADGGTILLDEVGETSPAMQVRLLRVLQDGEVCMVGSNRPRIVDVRVIAATNRDLADQVKRGVFREDLYFRLNVLTLEAPPLRDRDDDVAALTRHFVARLARTSGRAVPELAPEVLEALRGYRWPGNVRELENTIHRLVVMCDGDTIELPDLPPALRFTASRSAGLLRSLAEVEAEHVRNVLAEVGHNKSQAARILGIDRKTLREKIRKYEIPDS
jgi:two-component system, NtrC family, response regulator HydG